MKSLATKTLKRNSILKNYSTLLGQPTSLTHPHLIKTTEVSKGFTRNEFKSRLEKFIKSMKDNSVACIPSNMTTIMTNDIPYTFRQNSNFYYLTGFLEPDSMLVIQKTNENDSNCLFFVQPKDEFREKWDGPRAGVDIARNYFDFENTFSIEEIEKYSILDNFSLLYYDQSANSKMNVKLNSIIQNCKVGPTNMANSNTIFNQLKAYKSPAEIEMLKRSAEISAVAFSSAMRSTKPGMSESHIEAILEFECRLKGGQRLAYPPVIASGNNANTMHYVQNTQMLKDGDLLLIDAGCEYFQYPSDITRTWPINGKYTKEQRDVYEAVLRVQKICIENCKIGIDFIKLQNIALQTISEELVRLGVCTNENVNKIIGKLYPHNIGHPLGQDIHEEEPNYNVKFQPGMVVTVEPGIYIPKDFEGVPEQFKGIGIRIEDNILITESGNENLTYETPKEIEDIEKIMSKKSEFHHYVQKNFEF
eukprot:gene1854-995_t